MQQPYENLYIGSFIFALGYAAGRKNTGSENTFAHLIQQTPKDKEWADLLAAWEGRQFLFEFKRNEKWLCTERTKSYCKSDCPEDCSAHGSNFFTAILSDEHEQQRSVSDKCHFAAYGHINGDESDIRFISYRKIENSTHQTAEFYSLNSFCEKMQSGRIEGATPDEMKSYLDFLSKCVSGSGKGTTGVLISVGKDGSIKCASLVSIDTLASDLYADDPSPLPQTESVDLSKKSFKI